MSELIRDTVFGHLVRLVSGGKFLQYEEERDASLWKRYVDVEKSGNMALHGTITNHSEDAEKKKETKDRRSSRRRQQQQQQDDDASTINGDINGNGRRKKSSRDVDGGDGEWAGSGEESSDENGNTINKPSGHKVDAEKGKDAYVVDWWGPDDPENPQNWSANKKFFVTFEICLLTFSVYIGSAIYSAGIMDVTMVFGVSQVAATLGLSLFVLGYALGPMIWAPMSEIPQIGRNPVYIGTLVVFVVFQVPTALAVNFGMLLAFRFLTGFIGSPALATGGASIGDMYTPAKRTYGLAVWGIGAVCGPTLGPLVGGFAVEAKGWTWTIWELMWLSGATLVLLIFFLPETSSANILYRRARRLRKLTGNDRLVCEPEIASAEMTGRDIAMMSLVRPFQLCFTEPIVFALNMYIALIYGLLYIWFESFPIVFVEIYGFSLGTQGLAFLGIFVGVVLVVPVLFWYQYKYIEPKFNENGEIKPEWRLPPALVGSFCIPICLFWFGWTSRESVHWIVPIIGTAWFGIGTFLLFNAVLNYLSDAYPTYAASILAGNDFIRSAFGGGFPLFAAAMYNKLGVGWASSLLGFLGIAFIPIPFVLFYYGEGIRKKSKKARHDL